MPRRLKKLSLTEQHRFWSKVDVSQDSDVCWKWKASLNEKGYGRFGVRGAEFKAHRLAFYLFHQNINDAMLVLHRCDTPCCCNPYHLFQGTARTNAQDAVKKNRHTRLFGEQNGNVKLTAAAVAAIRRMRGQGATVKFLAQHFGVAQSTISYVSRELRWIKRPSNP